MHLRGFSVAPVKDFSNLGTLQAGGPRFIVRSIRFCRLQHDHEPCDMLIAMSVRSVVVSAGTVGSVAT